MRPCILCVWLVPVLRCKQAVGANGADQTDQDPALHVNDHPPLIKTEQNNEVKRVYVRFKYSIRTCNQRLDRKCEGLMSRPVDLITSTEYLCHRPNVDKYVSPSWLSRGSPWQSVPIPPARSLCPFLYGPCYISLFLWHTFKCQWWIICLFCVCMCRIPRTDLPRPNTQLTGQRSIAAYRQAQRAKVRSFVSIVTCTQS